MVENLRCITMGAEFHVLGVPEGVSLAECNVVAKHLALLTNACDDGANGYELICDEFGPTV